VDVAEAVTAVHDDPGPLQRALEQFPSSLLHGDAKLENIGRGAEKAILIDWGDLTGYGPAEVDVAWYAVRGSARIDADLGDLFADYEAASGRKLDPRALDLVCLGSLAQMGFRMANSATLGRPETHEVGRSQLDWWTGRVRPVLDSLPY
jgi:aminoglycoside phosphotransferase (APT) family kinase protein